MRWVALAAVVAAAALVPAGHVQGQTPDMAVPALLSRGTTSSVVFVDARTLALRPGRRLFVGRHDFPWSRSPDGARIVLGSGRTGGLRFVRLRPLGLEHLLPVRGRVTALAWVAPRRVLVVVAGRCCPAPVRVLVVDPQRPGRRVLRSRTIGRGGVLDAARTAEGLALVLGGEGRVAAAMLVALDASGRVRSRVLPPIRAGSRQLRPKLIEYRTPGLAIDRGGGRAYVVGGFRTVAEVDLRTLSVEYHRLAARQPQARRDGGNAIGETRRAVWVNGRLAVTGYDDRLDRGKPVLEPYGLELVNPRDWSVRTLDPAVRVATRTAGMLVGWYGGDALVVFDTGGRERLRIARTPAGGGIQLHWPFAYRGLDNEYRRHRVDVVDLRSGRVSRASVPGWVALLGDQERLCWC
jgi:hypothetical protein